VLRKRGIWSPRVESDEGFVVLPRGPFSGVEYRENGRSVRVQAERTLSKREIMLFSDRPETWDPPSAGAPMSEPEWRRILQNVTDALEFLGLRVEVVPPLNLTPEVLAALREEFQGRQQPG